MVLAGRFEWEQTADDVLLLVPLKGCAPASVDVYVAREYVKVNFRPYLIQVDLFAQVDDVAAVPVVRDGVLRLRLPKLEPGRSWPALQCPEHGDKKAMKERRIKAMDDKQEREAQQHERLKERAMEDEKLSTRMQMRSDELERQHLDDRKEEEKQEAEASVYAALRELQPQQSPPADDDRRPGLRPEDDAPAQERGDHALVADRGEDNGAADKSEAQAIFGQSDLDAPEHDAVDQVDKEESEAQVIFDTSDLGVEEAQEAAAAAAAAAAHDAVPSDDLERVLPAPRSAARVKLQFTARVFPTPMRESRREEEEDWLLRNRRHMKGAARKRLDAVDISERDPAWLKAKGDDLFKAGNCQAALNAYSSALEVDPAQAACLSNRAACWLRLCRFSQCASDCDALQQLLDEQAAEEAKLASEAGLPPPKELRRTAVMRRRVHVRRGAAFAGLERWHDALAEYQRALEMAGDAELEADCAALSRRVQSAARKDLGDEAFKAGDVAKADEHYSAALALAAPAMPAPPLLNRAACREGADRAADCRAAIASIDADEADLRAAPEEMEGRQDRLDRLAELKLKALLRLGKTQEQLGESQDALETYRAALVLSPTKALAKRVKRLELALAPASE